MMKRICVREWCLMKIENWAGTDFTGTKLLERGIFLVDISEISISCDIQLVSSQFLECDIQHTFGEAASAIDRSLEVAFATTNDGEISKVAIEISGKYVHESLRNELVSLSCKCCVNIISNGKKVYEYSPAEVLKIGSIYKNFSSKLISVGCASNDFPTQLSAFYLLERALQWLSLIHPNELEEEAETLVVLKQQCYNNMALLQLNFCNFSAVKIAASFVLTTNKCNIKALYRRAVANINLQNYALAKSDLQVILNIEPTNKAAKSQIEILEKKSSQLDKHYAQAMRKFLKLS